MPSGPQSGDSGDRVIATLEKALDRNDHWIQTADAKIGVILGFLVVVSGAVLARAATAAYAIYEYDGSASKKTIFTALMTTMGFPFLIATTMATLECFHGLLPKDRDRNGVRPQKQNPLYFGDTADQEEGALAAWSEAATDEAIRLAFVEQIVATGWIAREKFSSTTRAIKWLLILMLPTGVLLWMLCYLALESLGGR